jgi:hypothetical protein
MKYRRLKLAFGIWLTTVMAGITISTGLASEATNDNLSADQIFKKAAEAYASLTSYSDQGRIVTTVDGSTKITSFLTRLARPNFYLVEWQQGGDVSYFGQAAGAQAAWFSGAGDFLETGNGPQNEGGTEIALDLASAFSDGASATIPMVFFNLPLGRDFGGSLFEEHQQPDEKIGKIDCYVFSSELQGKTRTLWIGKQDFLIHQVRTVLSAEAMQAAVAQIPNETPQMAALLHEFTSTETHTNIFLNQSFSRSDFIPAIPHFAPPVDDEN